MVLIKVRYMSGCEVEDYLLSKGWAVDPLGMWWDDKFICLGVNKRAAQMIQTARDNGKDNLGCLYGL